MGTRQNCPLCNLPVDVAGSSATGQHHPECENKEILQGLRDVIYGSPSCTKCFTVSEWLMVIIKDKQINFHCRKCAVDQVVFNSGSQS